MESQSKEKTKDKIPVGTAHISIITPNANQNELNQQKDTEWRDH